VEEVAKTPEGEARGLPGRLVRRGSGPISFDFAPVPEAKEFPRVDLVGATASS
jgi:hypothetical protein